MNQIYLTDGLVLLSGHFKIGKTSFSLKLGNYLANKEKVLFLNFDDYEEKLRVLVEGMDTKVNEKFDIDSSLDNFCLETYIELLSLLENNKYSTIIIDNLNRLVPQNGYMVGDFDYNFTINTVINSLLYIIRQFKCRIILIYALYDIQIKCQALAKEYVRLNNFIFPRTLVNNCNQIFYLDYPYSRGYIVDEEGEDLINHIELYSLKNDKHNEEFFILDNSKLNIYKRYEQKNV